MFQFEVLENTLQHCRGVLYAHNSLYVCATNSRGFYRLRDTNGDDRFDDVQQLKFMDYQSRYGHGTNQVVLGPDNMLYVVNGNDVAFPEGVAAESPYRDPEDDKLLPESRDAVDEVRVGHILRTDPDGRRWEVVAGGFRNQVDVAFNDDGEMFTYDADMEWEPGVSATFGFDSRWGQIEAQGTWYGSWDGDEITIDPRENINPFFRQNDSETGDWRSAFSHRIDYESDMWGVQLTKRQPYGNSGNHKWHFGANFILVDFSDADAARAHLMSRGVIAREMGGYGLPNSLRIGIGLEEDMHAVVDACAEFLALS